LIYDSRRDLRTNPRRTRTDSRSRAPTPDAPDDRHGSQARLVRLTAERLVGGV